MSRAANSDNGGRVTTAWAGNRVGAALVALALCGGCDDDRNTPASGVVALTIDQTVSINGVDCPIRATATIDEKTGEYSSAQPLSCAVAMPPDVCPLDVAVAAWLPKIALQLLIGAQGDSLHGLAGQRFTIQVAGAPKRDPKGDGDRLAGTVTIQGDAGGGSAMISVSGQLTTRKEPCRKLAADGSSVIRIGIKPTVEGGRFTGGSFVGGGNIEFDLSDDDPEGLGGIDFWNLEGTFVAGGSASGAPRPVASINRSELRGGGATMGGKVDTFPGSTVTTRGIFTFSGDAAADGFIHKHNSIANMTGGGLFLGHFDVPVHRGETPAVVAARTADMINRAPFGFQGGGHLLAVQGTVAVGTPAPELASPSVGVCQTTDGISCATPTDAEAARVFSQVGTQLFSSAEIGATGMAETFGILGDDPLVGWLTPFKTLIATDVAPSKLAVGGSVTVGVNICRSTSGGGCDKGTVTTNDLVVIETVAGQTDVDIARSITRGLVKQGIDCIQRIGAVVFMDAGLEMPSTLTVGSRDPGVRIMGAAADVVSFLDAH